MRLFGLTITRTPAPLPRPQGPITPTGPGTGGWWPVVREPFTGAWQQNLEIRADTVLMYSAVFACVTQISSDIAKLGLWLVQESDTGIWLRTTSPAFSPVLRKPNRYQSRIKFIESWLTSKLIHGNTYVLKQRDERGVVVALYVLDPTRVCPLVAEDGAVYYELRRDALSGVGPDHVVVPASEIIHDLMVALYHPLCGVSPIYACGLAALQGLAIQDNSNSFFSNGSKPGGVLLAPGPIKDETASRLKAYWEANFSGANVGKVAVLGDGLKYEAMTVNATDAQLIEQLRWTGETVCSCFHMPAYKVGIGPMPTFNNIEALNQQYYSDCLQSLMWTLELALEEGLGLGAAFGNRYAVEFDPDDLIWLDSATRTAAAKDGIAGGALSPDEARRKYYGLGPVDGGDTPYLQQQMFSLRALAERDADQPFSKPTLPPPAVTVPPPPADDDDETLAAQLAARLLRRAQEVTLHG